MITVLATCARDGQVIIGPHDITLVWCVDAPDTGGSWYTFRCPTCGVVNQKPADLVVVNMLQRVGVVPRQWAIGAGRTPFRIDGLAVDEDDLIAFGLRLHARPAAVDPFDLTARADEREAA